MALPAANSAWPPAAHTKRYSRLKALSTWYGGDPDALIALYGGNTTQATDSPGIVQRVFSWFWSKNDATAPNEKMHVPLAADIATMSSELVGNGIKWQVQFTEFDEDGTPSESQKTIVAKTQARLDELLESCNFEAVLLAGLETSAALGSFGLRIGYDKTTGMTKPVIMRVDADSIVPEYSWGQLVAVTLWRVVADENGSRWIHLERHERGAIYHGLYCGVIGNLGQPVPLTDRPETSALAQIVDADSKVITVPDVLTAVSVPNMLPDPLDRRGEVGRSDFTPGVLTLFDAVDRVYTSLMRDIDDGESKLIIADYMLDDRGAGKGVGFNENQHLFTKLRMQPGENGDAPITQVQFKIRVDEHIKAIDLLTRKAIESCGYNPDSDNGGDGQAITATEYNGKAARSVSTRAKKLRYLQTAEQLLEGLLKIDAAYFASGVTPLPVRMVAPPALNVDIAALAATVNLMKQAEASSIRVRVKTLHPDWDNDEIDAEVEAIQAESSVVDPLTFGLGGAGISQPKEPAAPVDADTPIE